MFCEIAKQPEEVQNMSCLSAYLLHAKDQYTNTMTNGKITRTTKYLMANGRIRQTKLGKNNCSSCQVSTFSGLPADKFI